jgi:hypothetical protein
MSTIYIASKLPWDLECRVHRPEKYYEPSPMGPLERTRMIPTGARTLIRGVAYPFQPQPAFVAFRPAPQMFYGFAVTVLDGENAKNFCLWWQQNHNADEPNKSLPAIASGLLLWDDDLQNKVLRKCNVINWVGGREVAGSNPATPTSFLENRNHYGARTKPVLGLSAAS